MRAVFVAYTRQTPPKELGKTLDAWDMEGFEPIAIEVKSIVNETVTRVAAEAILKSIEYLDPVYYVAPLGSRPGDEDIKTYRAGEGVKVEACSPRVQ